MLDRLLASRRLHLPLVILIAAAIALPGLGWAGLSSSEGHRAIPGWTMLQTGDWSHIRLFEQAYFRKPPGMPWVIAASSWLLGLTETAARLPSAIGFIAMSGIAFGFARRWFGDVAALAAGLSQALLPVIWPWARSAEIELLNALATQAAMLLLVDLLLYSGPDDVRPAPKKARSLATIALAGALIAMALLKGPSGLPAFAGMLAGVCLASTSLRPLRQPLLWTALGLAAIVLAPLGWWIAAANASPQVITQDAREFLWSADRAGAIALLPLSALGAAMPASLGLLFCWDRIDRTSAIARSLGAGFLLALAISVALGISNHRYLLPAMPLLPLLMGYATHRPASLPRVMPSTIPGLSPLLRSPLLLPAFMIVAAMLMVPTTERSRERNSGRLPGRELADRFAPLADVHANELIDARPDVLWYLHRARPDLRIRWSPGPLRVAELPPPGAYLVLRDDSASMEYLRFRRAHASSFSESGEGRVSGYHFKILRVTASHPDAPIRPE